MFHEDDEDQQPEPLSPLMEAIVPKLASCRIREYAPEDLDACIEIYHSNEPDFLSPEGLDHFVEFLQSGTSYLLVVENGGDVIGCGGLELVGDSDTAMLMHGMIHREYHRRGFGTTLLAARIALLETDERPLELWLRTPPRAAGFYDRFGFRLEKLDLDRPNRRRDHGAFSLQLEPQDILDVRDALEEREIRIHLDDQEDEEEEADEMGEEELGEDDERN
ncbi:MAG: GNAT family N-acetyltransferase [Verrucomicrobiota bacterium]